MLTEYGRYNTSHKEYQKLFNDESYQLYVAFEESEGKLGSPRKYLLEYDSARSSDGSDAILGWATGYFVGRTDKYAFFRRVSEKTFDRLEDLRAKMKELPLAVRTFVEESLKRQIT